MIFYKTICSSFLLFFLLWASCITPKKSSQIVVPVIDTTIVMFYNVENLFDTINSKGNRDAEFTPDGKNEWTAERYRKKLTDLARVITAIDSPGFPVLTGLCEVENRLVLQDLAEETNKRGARYGIVHYESPDERGIDVALFYDTAKITIAGSRPLTVLFEDAPKDSTRDILYAEVVVKGMETLHVFVTHWPSRAGGHAASEPKRIQAALTLRKVIDSLLVEDPLSKIIVMGDFNDEPADTSLKVLGSGWCRGDSISLLCNLMMPLKEQGLGSYSYRNNWNMLDNIMVSPGLLPSTGKVFVNFSTGAGIYTPPWLQYVDEKNGQTRPNRTYLGTKYIGGYSDHYPVYMYLFIKK